MTGIIAILEDNEERIRAMETRLKDAFTGWEHVFFNNAPDAIAWFQNHLHQCILISLDHDLGPSWERNGQLFDPGTGRDVVNYLIKKPPQCPVILHTSNSEAEIGMEMALAEVNWTFERVIPFQPLDSLDSLEWVDRDWANTVQRMLASSAKKHCTDLSENLSDWPHPHPQVTPSPRLIIVLDNSQHCAQLMKEQLDEVFPAWSSVCFQDPIELMAWFSSNTLQFNRLFRAKTIAILDNNKKRIDLMHRHLDEFFPHYASIFFDNAPDAIAWFENHLQKCALISLDHNLGGIWTREEKLFDPGTGRDVVDYLSTKPPQCPIIFHTSNKEAEISMEMALIESNWIFERVFHSKDLKWIEKAWIPMMKLLLNPIPNSELRESDIPCPNARWQLFNQFALSFDGYKYWESPEQCIEVGDRCAEMYLRQGVLPNSLAKLRTAMLVERNRWRGHDAEPDDDAMVYIRAIADCIREKIRAHEIE